MVDFFMINVVVQGLNLGKLIRRKLIAPKKLTQFEMNEAYSVKVSSHSKYGSRTTHISHSKYGSRTTYTWYTHRATRTRPMLTMAYTTRAQGRPLRGGPAADTHQVRRARAHVLCCVTGAPPPVVPHNPNPNPNPSPYPNPRPNPITRCSTSSCIS